MSKLENPFALSKNIHTIIDTVLAYLKAEKNIELDESETLILKSQIFFNVAENYLKH